MLMRYLPISKGLRTLIDEEDFREVSKYRWYAQKQRGGEGWYVRGYVKGKMVYLHRFLLRPPANKQVDHKNRDGLDNRKENLRICSSKQNAGNKATRSQLGYKGVYYHKSKDTPYDVRCCTKYLGSYKTLEEALQVYNQAALEAFGEFAVLNEIS